MEYEQIIKRYVCRFCKGSFDQPENLHKHVQQIHTVRTSTKDNRTCLICGVQGFKSEDYHNHLRHIHGVNDEGQVFSFKCFNDFLLWKNETEKRNYCKFVARGVPKVLPSKDKIHLYQCDSSGSKAKDKKSFVAVKDTCPAMISAVESAKARGVKVEYWNNHIGHPVPVEDDELDAAINSLQVPEIVLGDDQRIQTDSDGNIYILSENTENSLSETVVSEVVPKAKKSLFMKNNSQSTSQSKPDSQRFSFRKDPSKKMPSFQFSLASVACMKPKIKPKKTEEDIAVTAIENDNTDSNTAFSAASPPPVESIVEPSEHASNENSSENNTETTTQKAPVKEQTPVSQPPAPPKPSSSTTQSNIPNFNLISDGIASGQYVILNSVPGENGVQNLLLCPVSTSNNPSSSAVTNPSEDIIIISPPGEALAEKEDTSSVQNVLTLKSNTPLPDDVEKSFVPSGKSVLKNQKAKKGLPKKNTAKTPASSQQQLLPGYLLKDIKSISTLAASNKPATALTPILVSSLGSTVNSPTYISSTSGTPSNPRIASSVGATPPTVKGFSPKAAAYMSSVRPTSNVQNVLTFNIPQAGRPTPQYVNSNLCGPIVGQTMLPSGQMSFMTFNNNLIPIANNTTPYLSPNMNSSFVIPSPTPVIKNQQSSLPVISQPSGLSGAHTNAVNQIMSTIGKTLPPNAVPIIILPSGENLTSIPSPLLGTKPDSSKIVKSSAASIVSSGQNLTTSRNYQYSSSLLPGGAQVIPVSTTPTSSKLLSQTPKSLLSTSMPKTTLFPSLSKSAISTPISNAVQIKKVQTPSCSTIVNPINNISMSTTLRPLVLSDESLGSNSTITIPCSLKDRSKPLYFKSSSGGVYILEPVEDSVVENLSTIPLTPDSNSGLSTKEELNAHEKNNSVGSQNKTSEHVKGNIPVINIDDGQDENVLDLNKKVSDPVPNHLDVKIDRKLKSPPRKTPEFRNGVQIKSVVQDKRPFKEDDVEILKKVKYYQMEMKYLSSQAECKRLKLELAKAKMKIEANLNKDVIPNDKPKEPTVIDGDDDDDKQAECETFDSTFSMDVDNVCDDSDSEDDQTVVDSVVEGIVAKVIKDIDPDDDQSMDVEVSKESGQPENDEIMQSMNVGMDGEEMAVEQSSEPEVQPSLDVNGKEALHIPDFNKSLEISELAQQVVDANNPTTEEIIESMIDEQPIMDLHPEEDITSEALRSLEDQYGKQSSLNIYTMIRTPVLRSLYEDMKGLCEENKKLFEELQFYRAHGHLYDVLGEELQ